MNNYKIKYFKYKKKYLILKNQFGLGKESYYIYKIYNIFHKIKYIELSHKILNEEKTHHYNYGSADVDDYEENVFDNPEDYNIELVKAFYVEHKLYCLDLLKELNLKSEEELKIEYKKAKSIEKSIQKAIEDKIDKHIQKLGLEIKIKDEALKNFKEKAVQNLEQYILMHSKISNTSPNNELIDCTVEEINYLLKQTTNNKIQILNNIIEKFEYCLSRCRTNEIIMYYFSSKLAWAFPNKQVIDDIYEITGERQILEVCAGNGLWAALLQLRGCNIIATDMFSSHNMLKKNTFIDVKEYDAVKSVIDYKTPILMLCMPNYHDEFAHESLCTFEGDTLIFIGSDRGGNTASDSFFDQLESNWNLIKKSDEIINNSDGHLYIYIRKH